VAGPPGRIVKEDIEMVVRTNLFSSACRAAVVAAVAALALTALQPSPAEAGSVTPGQGLSAHHVTDFSARRRIRHHHGDRFEIAAYRHRGGSDAAEAEIRHAYWEAFNAYYGGGVVYDNHGPFYAEFGGYGSAVPPYLWGPGPGTW
jgi:hypothetical protein